MFLATDLNRILLALSAKQEGHPRAPFGGALSWYAINRATPGASRCT